MESQCHFDLHFLYGLKMLNFFSCSYCLFILLFLRTICSVHLPIYWLITLFFWCLIFWVLYMSGYYFLVRWIAGKVSLPFCRLSLRSGNWLPEPKGRSLLIWYNPICQVLVLFLSYQRLIQKLYLEMFSHSISGLTLRPLIQLPCCFLYICEGEVI
jgi:hypothetical protein